MNLTEIHAAIRHRLDEEDVDNSHWSSDRLTAFTNVAVGDVAKRLPPPLIPLLEMINTQTLSNGVNEYTLPSDFFRIKHVLLNYAPDTQSIHIPAHIITHEFLHAIFHNSFYEPTTTNPFALIYGGKVLIYPVPTALASQGLKNIYLRPPAQVSAADDIPEVPSWSHDWVVLDAVYLCLSEDDQDKAKSVLGEYLEKFSQFGGMNGKSIKNA